MFKSIFIVASMLSIFCGSVFAESDSAKVVYQSKVVVGKIARDAFIGTDGNYGWVTFPVKSMKEIVRCRIGIDQCILSKDFLLCILLKDVEVKLVGAYNSANTFFMADSIIIDYEKYPKQPTK